MIFNNFLLVFPLLRKLKKGISATLQPFQHALFLLAAPSTSDGDLSGETEAQGPQKQPPFHSNSHTMGT